MPGPTSTILDRNIMVNDIRLHYKKLDHYPNSIGKRSLYHIFEVSDSMRDLLLRFGNLNDNM